MSKSGRGGSGSRKTKRPNAADQNIFRELGFAEDEAVNLQIRCLLAIEISDIIDSNGWTQKQAAEVLEVPQPRIAEIVKTKIDHYSIDLLVKYLTKLGRRVSFSIEKIPGSAY
jgi:predicted XRE-type DNA-binding protein